SHPRARLAYQVKDSDTELLLLSKAQSGSELSSGLDVLLMDGVTEDAWLVEFDAGERAELSAGQEAYVLYTSGSTGQPKGVSVKQEHLGHYLAHAKTYLTPEMAGAVVSSPLCFDATITSLLTPLCTGQSVQLLPDGDAALMVLPGYLNDRTSSWLFKLTPSHLDALSESVEANEDARHVLVIGGEQWLCGSLRRWQGELLRGSVFVNEYGPTETVVGTSVFRTGSVDAIAGFADGEGVPIGVPIAGSQLYVLGAGGQRQPLGSVGELYIGGAGVSGGYLNQEAQTLARFVDFEGERVYRTGDLVRRNGRGDLVFIGRADEQLSLNGYRIEPGDIKSHLLAVDGVSQAEVLVVQTRQGQRLVAYVVADEGSWAQTESACQRHLSAQLAEYMQPTAYLRLDRLPLTANGKLDRKGLPSVDVASKVRADEVAYVAPVSGTEQAIAKVWGEVLSVERVGLEDNFFSLGGDS
ncbi:AMP-binding protein, partial [Rheinheimera soli]